MKKKRLRLAAVLCAGGIAVAAGGARGISGVTGGLDAAGGPGRSRAFTLISSSLGQPFQTGNLASSHYRLSAGMLHPVQIPPPEITGDFNGDAAVDFEDFLLFAGGYGKAVGEAGYDVRFDLDGDGAVGFPDFLVFARVFGYRA